MLGGEEECPLVNEIRIWPGSDTRSTPGPRAKYPVLRWSSAMNTNIPSQWEKGMGEVIASECMER